MNADEFKKMLNDSLSAGVLDKALESREAAAAATGKTVLTPGDESAPDLAAALSKAGTVVAPIAGDKGLDFARWFLATAAEKKFGEDPIAYAKRNGYSDTVQKALSEGSFANGGMFVRDQVSGDFLDLLRSATVCRESGMREVPFKGSLTLGRQNAAATASWIGEAANITNSAPTFGELQLRAKKLGAGVVISNDLLRNPNVAIEAKVRDDLVAVAARKLDLACLEGTGTAYEPRGLSSGTSGANGWVASANQNDISGTALADKVSDLGRAIRLIESNNVPFTNFGWVMHPRTKWALMTTLDSQGNFVFMQEMSQGRLFGFPFRTSTAQTISGSNYKIFAGCWSHYLLGVDTDMQVELMPNAAYYNGSTTTAGASTDESFVRLIGRFDTALTYDTAFTVTSAVSY